MQFQVPQFIEVEDKIFGPLTFKQFVYLVGGAGISFVFYRMFPLFIAIFLILPIMGISLALAFYKINNKPFIFTLEAAFKYFVGSKLYLWKKSRKKRTKKERREERTQLKIPQLSESKLKDLSWSLDVKEKIR